MNRGDWPGAIELGAGMGQWVVKNCIKCALFFLGFIPFSLFPFHYYYDYNYITITINYIITIIITITILYFNH